MIPVQLKKAPELDKWKRAGKYDIYVDPMTDDGIKPLLREYAKVKANKKPSELKVRVDEYKHITKPNEYPAKYVTIFEVDTKEGKVEAPTIEDLMDKLDQQQLRWQSADGRPNLMVHDALYSNDKILELEMLERMEKSGPTKTANGKTIPASLGPKGSERIKALRELLITSGQAPKPTGPKGPTLSPEAAAAAAIARSKELSSQLPNNLKQRPTSSSGSNQGSNGGSTPGSPASTLSIKRPTTPNTPVLGPSPASSASSSPKSTKGGKQRTRRNRNRRNKNRRNKTNRN